MDFLREAAYSVVRQNFASDRREAMLIQLQSMSEAVRLRRALLQQGVQTSIVQTPASMRHGGCGYSLHVARSTQSVAEKIAEEKGLRIVGIYGSDLG